MFKLRRNSFNNDSQIYNGMASSSRSKKIVRLIIVISILAVAGLVGRGIYARIQNNPDKVSLKFVQLLKKGQTDKSFALTSKSFGLVVDKGEWANDGRVYQFIFTKDIKKEGEVKTSDFSSKNPSKAYSFLVGGDSSNYRVIVITESVESKWLVAKYTVSEEKQ